MHVFLNEGLDETELTDKVELCKDIVDLYEFQYKNAQASRLEAYETKRDLGSIPFRWNLNRAAVVAFDHHKTVNLNWES